MGDFDSVFAKFNEKAKRQAAGRRPTSSGGRDEDDEMDELSRRMAELNRAGSQEKPLPGGRPGRGRGRGRSRERDDEGSYWQAPVRQPNGRDRSPDGQRGPSRPPQYDRADYNDYDDDGRGPSRHRNPSADRPPRDLDSAEREEHGRRGRPDHPPAKSARPQGNHARDRDHDRDGDREAPRSCSSDRDPERRRHRDSSCDRSRPGARGHPGERGRVDDRRRPPPRRHDTRDDEEEEDYDVPSSRSQHLDRGHRVNERHQQYRTDHYDDRPRYSRDRRYDGDDSDDEGYESKLERRKREQLQSKIDLLERDLDRYSSRAGDGISTSAREDELERLKREKQLLADKRRVDEESLVRWQRELENKERTVGTTKSASELAREKETAQKHFDRYHYGIDICFLLDCTGSMGSWMRVAGEKVRDVMEIAPEKFPNAVTRIAFVGYRDYGDGDLREEVYDFADADQVDELKRKVLSMKPFGGGDTPEDIAGGLNNATKLNWKSSTRLVIHIADAPCHGTKYHTCRDSHAAGDPSGLVPEDLLRKLCNKSVDYYFVKINALTDQMIAIFEQVYQNSGRSFQVFNIGDNPAEFLPLVIKSVASSISRSEAFKKAPSPTKGLGLY